MRTDCLQAILVMGSLADVIPLGEIFTPDSIVLLEWVVLRENVHNRLDGVICGNMLTKGRYKLRCEFIGRFSKSRRKIIVLRQGIEEENCTYYQDSQA